MKKNLYALGVMTSITTVSLLGLNMLNKPKTLRIAASNHWGALSPPEQATSMADTLLGNAFEPLIDLATTGGIAPGVADRWETNADSTEFTFYLRKATYSDGTELSASDFIRSWLAASTFESIDSANHNTLDVLYRIKGFSLDAARAGKVDGLSALDDRTLRVTFKAPFRTALFELSGTRYAAWKREPMTGRFIGTGSYRITRHEPGKLVQYAPNAHAHRPAKYGSVEVLGFNEVWKEANPSDFDVIMGQDPKIEIPQDIKQAPGSIVGHLNLFVSGQPDSFFNSKELRLALQYLIHVRGGEALKKNPYFQNDFDSQIYPPLWPGRLDEEEVIRLVRDGEKYLQTLLKKNQQNPIRFRSRNPHAPVILENLEKLGLIFDEASKRPLMANDFLAVAYGKAPYDVALIGTNVVGSDPDSIYHLLGQNGAIHSPPLYRESVATLLETGRGLLNTDNLDNFYKDVSREVLKEVPLIHLQFARADVYVNTRKVSTEKSLNNSDRFSFNQLNSQGDFL